MGNLTHSDIFIPGLSFSWDMSISLKFNTDLCRLDIFTLLQIKLWCGIWASKFLSAANDWPKEAISGSVQNGTKDRKWCVPFTLVGVEEQKRLQSLVEVLFLMEL